MARDEQAGNALAVTRKAWWRVLSAAIWFLVGSGLLLALVDVYSQFFSVQPVENLARSSMLAGAPAWDEYDLIWDEAPSMHDSEPRHDYGEGYYFPLKSRTVHGKQLPRRVVLCYTDWDQCDDTVLQSARGGGCNVLAWSFINFRRVPAPDSRGVVQVTGGPNIDCFRRVATALSGWDVVHLVSVGGWNQVISRIPLQTQVDARRSFVIHAFS